MTIYEPSLILDIEHLYFEDRACTGLKLVPEITTAKLLERPEIVCRASEHRVVVSVDRHARTLDQLFEDSPLPLQFFAIGTDQQWPLVTELDLLPSRNPPTLALGNETDDGQRKRLHAKESVQQDDFAAAGDDATAAIPHQQPPAYFTLTLPLGPVVDGVDHYVLRFAARSTRWRYNIVGSLARQAADGGLGGDIRVVDAEQDQAFSRDDDTALSNGRTAIRFRSAEPLSLQQRSRRHFQLVAGPEDDRDVLISRLPLAGAGYLAEGGAISEIYVHT